MVIKKDELGTLHQIIVIIDGKQVINEHLKKNIDNVVILSKNKYINTKLTKYIDHLRTIYFREPSEPAIDYLENEIIKELAPNNKINKVYNKPTKPLDDFYNESIKPINDIDVAFKQNQEKFKKMKAKLNGNNKQKFEIDFETEKAKRELLTIKTHIIKKKKLKYKDIKPYLTKRQLELIQPTAHKRDIEYETALLTMDLDYFNKELEKVKKDSTKSFLGNKHINTEIGKVYRIFVEKRKP